MTHYGDVTHGALQTMNGTDDSESDDDMSFTGQLFTLYDDMYEIK